MRTALVVVAVGVAVLIAAAVVSARTSGRAGASWVIGSHEYALGGGSCQTVGGDFSVSVVGNGDYFHLIWTPKKHGNDRTVAWRWTYLTNDAIVGAKIKFADGRKSGTFSGVSTKGVRTTGSFSCG